MFARISNLEESSVAIIWGEWESKAGNNPKTRFFPLGFLKPLYVSTSLCKKVNLGS